MNQSTQGGQPGMSIIVTIVDGGDVLRHFMDALIGQEGGPSMQILVPYDATIPEIRALESAVSHGALHRHGSGNHHPSGHDGRRTA